MNMLQYISRNTTRALSLLAALLICSTAGAATYYVDAVNGNDSNSGISTSSAWRTLGRVNSAALYAGDTVLFRRGDSFRGQLVPKSGSSSSYITYSAYGTGNKPLLLGSVRKNLTSDWVSEGGNIWTTAGTFSADVGNLILNGERSCGVKVFSRAELNAQGKFWFNESTGKVSVYSTSNPASAWSDIECAVSAYIINEAGKSWVIFDNLALKYGGAHGIGGSGMSNIIIRDLEIGFIGGGKQDASGVRYGNGIEFIGSAQNLLVERCRIWDCYDAGLTNQNLSATLQNNITYRNNTVWNCEYSFEYWSNQSGATTSNITFENNTCAFAGGGWAHAQRPFKTGRHLHFDDNRAATSNFSIRNNIFYQALDNNIYLSPTWNNLSALNMDYNCWHNSQTGNMAVWQGTYYPMTQFSSYQSRSGKDSHSITSDPLFVNAGTRDFHLTSGSPCINRGYTGSKDPDGSVADLGAFPYGSSVPSPSDTQAPTIISVAISPNSGWVRAGSAVTITAAAGNSETGLTASNAQINGRSIPLSDQGDGTYRGVYTVQAADAQGVNIEATGITLSTPGAAAPLFADTFSDNNISDWTVTGSVTCRNERLEVTANGIEDMVTRSFSTNLNEAWCTYRIYVSSLSLPASGDKSAGCGFISPNAARGAYAGFVNSNGRPVWRIEYSTDTSNVAQAISSTPVTLGQWHTVTFMFKRSGGANDGQVKLWVDGALTASQTGLDNDTIQAQKAVIGDRYGVNVNGVYYIDDVSVSNSQTGGTGQTSAPASSSGSTLRVDTLQPAISSVVISPNTGTIYPGSSVTVTASARNSEAGLIPSGATVNSRSIPLWDRGNGTYSGVYVAQTGDPVGAVVEASGITLRDPAGNVSAPSSSSGSTLKVAASSTTAELLANPSFSVNADGWATYTEGDAAVSAGRDTAVYDSSPAGYRIQCIARGGAAHYIQFMTTRGMSITAGKRYTLTFRAKCTVPFTVNSIVLMKGASPWSWYQSLSTGGSPAIPTSWTTCTATFTASATASDARLTFYLGNSLANGATFYLDSMSFRESASGGAAKIASAGAEMSNMPSAPYTESVSERSARLAWTGNFLSDAAGGGSNCLLELRELTRGDGGESPADSSRVITPSQRSGLETTELKGLRPGARYSVSLRAGNDPVGGTCRRAFMNLTTLAAFVDEDLDRSDPFIARDSDSLFVADNDTRLTFAWSSWKSLGAAAYRITVHTHAPEGVLETRTITDTKFTFSGEPRQVYSVEIHPLTPGWEELGTISSRKILCAPASPGKPGNP